MNDIHKQSSKGDHSPNIIQHYYGGEEKKNACREVLSILKLIALVSELSEKGSTTETAEVAEKDLNKKLSQRFSKHKNAIEDEFKTLSLLYGDSLEDAREQSDITEFRAEEMSIYLERTSNQHLEEEHGNPIKALNKLAAIFEKKLEEKETEKPFEFSSGAIRFYLLKELIKCNVFPNPL